MPRYSHTRSEATPYFEAIPVDLCHDCVKLIANGEPPTRDLYELSDAWALSDATERHWPSAEGWSIDPMGRLDCAECQMGTCEGIGFTHHDCDGCGSRLGGRRHHGTAYRFTSEEEDAYRVPAMCRYAIEDIADEYLETVQWAEAPDPDTSSEHDLFDGVRERAIRDVARFLGRCRAAGIDMTDVPDIGHHLWLTRQGHGAGFWDGDFGNLGDKLTELARKMGELNVDTERRGRVLRFDVWGQ